jgi:hypothetical protein
MKEDLTAFFGDFATDVKVTAGSTFKAIIDAPFMSVGDGAGVESSALSLIAQTEDVADLAHGEILEVDNVEYVVRGIEPDGLGVTTIRLERV